MVQAKAIDYEAKAFKHMTRAEMNICSTSDSLTGYNFDCFCLDIQLLLIMYKLLLIYYYNYY